MIKLITLTFLIIGYTSADLDPTWCNPVTTSGEDYPEIPTKFTTTVESNFRSAGLGINFTSEFDEYYDFDGNRGLIVRSILFENVRQYFLYDTNEMITIFSKVCTVSKLDESTQGSPFGYEKLNNTGHIYSPSMSLRLNYTHQYIGEGTVRQINVKQWVACEYLPELTSTVKITWSFSNSLNWNSTIHLNNQSLSVPVEMLMEGKLDDGTEWTQSYEYIKFRPYIEDNEVFETPVGIYCPGRKPTKPLPKIPNHFSFRIEATSTDLNISTNQAEWYDDENKLVRIDSQTLSEKDIQLYGRTSITEIHDFKRGLRFIIDKKSERCLNYTILDPQSIDSDIANNSNYVRLRTALELFNFDKNNSYSYEYHGTRKIRDIDTDVWIAVRENWPPQTGIQRTSTWEWYFMSSNWTSFNDGLEEYNIPVKLIITNYNIDGSGFISNTIVYNYFDYNQEKPDIFTYDLQSCYTDIQIKHLVFVLDTDYSKVVMNKKGFKYAISDAISTASYVVPTRITNIEVEAGDGETVVVFKLLDKSPIKGNVENPVEDIKLDDAYSLLEKTINRGSLRFTYNGTIYTAKAKSLITVSMKQAAKTVEKNNIWFIVASGAAGIVIGIVVTAIIVAIMRRSRKSDTTLTMSSLNPNYK